MPAQPDLPPELRPIFDRIIQRARRILAEKAATEKSASRPT